MMSHTASWTYGTSTLKKRYIPSASVKKEMINIDGESIVINPNQKWFWSDEWQAGEKKADDDIKNGRIHHFNNSKEALQFLESPNVKP